MQGGEEVVGGKWWEDDFNGDETVRDSTDLKSRVNGTFYFTNALLDHRISTFLSPQPSPLI